MVAAVGGGSGTSARREDRNGGEREHTQFNESRGSARAACITFVSRLKTRECNHVVQCVTQERELFTKIAPR